MPRDFFLSCATCLLVAISVSAKSLTLIVATNGNDRWSGRLEKPARDGMDGPLATLPAALKTTRASRRNSSGPPERVTILLRGGTYSVAEPIVLTPEDSGSDAGHPFTIAAVRNERPVLSGGRQVRGWKRVEGQAGLWRAEVPEARAGKWYFRQLFVNGARKQRARSPGRGYYQHYGRENIVRNNIFAFGAEHQLMRTREEEHLSFIFTNNIVYFDSGTLLGSNWKNERFTIDYNVYFDARHGASAEALRFAGATFDQWRQRGHDIHSLFADPLFLAPKQSNFRLRDNSPALKLGFRPIDLSEVGVRKKFRKQVRDRD